MRLMFILQGPGPHTHSHFYGKFRVTNLPGMHVFGLWKEAKVPGENSWKRTCNSTYKGPWKDCKRVQPCYYRFNPGFLLMETETKIHLFFFFFLNNKNAQFHKFLSSIWKITQSFRTKSYFYTKRLQFCKMWCFITQNWILNLWFYKKKSWLHDKSLDCRTKCLDLEF